MVVLTSREKVIFACLVFTFLLGILFYYLKEGEFAASREKSFQSQTSKQTVQSLNYSNQLKINLNEATLSDLEKLPGIGPKTAQAILRLRETKRGFYRVEDLLEVRGIGKRKLQKIAKVVEVR